MNKKRSLVSIILPVHNDGNFLSDSIKSLLRQSYRNLEIIAIDDKSSDDSFKILKTIKKKDKRLRIYQNVKRYGIVTTLNRALKKAKGEYIAFTESSDVSVRDRLKKQLAFLSANPEVVAVGTQCYFISKKGKRIGKSVFPLENSKIYDSPLHGFSMQFETVMINRTLLPKDILKFGNGFYPFVFSDFLIKLLPYGKFANLPNFMHLHRNHPTEYISSVKRHAFSYIKLWLKSIESYDYTPSIRSLFRPLLKPV